VGPIVGRPAAPGCRERGAPPGGGTWRGSGREVDVQQAPLGGGCSADPDSKFFNAQRGCLRLTWDKAACRPDFRAVPYVTRAGAPVRSRASYVVEDGIPGTTEA
jgi:hypothetical protein